MLCLFYVCTIVMAAKVGFLGFWFNLVFKKPTKKQKGQKSCFFGFKIFQ